MRRRLFHLAATGLLLWAAAGCALELYRGGWLWLHDPWKSGEPGTWRITSRHAGRARAFAREMKAHLPAAAVVAVSSEPGPDSQRLFRYLWLTYLLPEVEMRRAVELADGLAAEYWLAYDTRLEHPRLELVHATSDGALYRVLPSQQSGSP